MLDALGIVNFEDSRVEVQGMSDFRTIPAMSFLGRYRIIDFVLSNMVNSGIDQIKVMVKDKPRSLIEHLGTGEQYNINNKHGFLQMLYPDYEAVNELYFHDLFLMKQNLPVFEDNRRRYVVIAPSYMVYLIDFGKVLEAHQASGADITCVYKAVKDADRHFIGCYTAQIDESGRIKAIRDNMGLHKEENILTECYVMTKETFIQLVRRASSVSPLFSLINILSALTDSLKLYGYPIDSYLACINSLEEYYQVNQSMIDADYARNLFRKDWTIFTQTNDSVPAFYAKSAHVKNCLIANGCEVYGDLENCILGRGVKVEEGAVIKNSLLLPYSYVAPYSHVSYAVVDKYARIVRRRDIVGDAEHLAYIRRRDRV